MELRKDSRPTTSRPVALHSLLPDPNRRLATPYPAEMELSWDCAKPVGPGNSPSLCHFLNPEEIKPVSLWSNFSVMRR